jgi:TRAP-type transport system periplasmic protein
MKWMFRIMILALLFALSVWFVPSLSMAQEKVVTLKYSNFFPASNRVSLLCEDWCKEVEKRTSGRVKVTYFPGGTLTPPVQTYDSVVKGIADIGFSFASYTRGKFPLTEVIDLPLGYKSALVGAKMVNEYYRKFKPKEFDEVKILFMHVSSPQMVFAKKPVNNLEDMKGLKVRSTGTSAQVVQALGGAPVGMPMSEAYDALSRGVAEGIVCPYEPMKGFKLAEVVRYCTQFGAAHSQAAFVVMNKAKWNSLSPDIQKILDALDEEWIERQGKLWVDLEVEAKEVFVQSGGKTTALEKQEDERWTKALRPMLDDYVKSMKAKNLPGDEALKFCVDYLKTH